MQVDHTKEEQEKYQEWQKKMKKDRKIRAVLRTKLYWEAIYVAFIPIGILRKCKKCNMDYKFEHMVEHLDDKLKYMVSEIIRIVNDKGSLNIVINVLKKEHVIEVWNIY